MHGVRLHAEQLADGRNRRLQLSKERPALGALDDAQQTVEVAGIGHASHVQEIRNCL